MVLVVMTDRMLGREWLDLAQRWGLGSAFLHCYWRWRVVYIVIWSEFEGVGGLHYAADQFILLESGLWLGICLYLEAE